MKYLIQIIVIVVITGVLGTISNSTHPRRIAWKKDWDNLVRLLSIQHKVPLLSFADAKEIVRAYSHTIVDARIVDDYNEGHLPGAISLPLEEFDDAFEKVANILDSGMPVMTYCAGIECDEALELALRLREQGCLDISVFGEGWKVWKKSGAEQE